VCDVCEGRKVTIDKEKACKECDGKKVGKNMKTFEVDLDKGCPADHKYTFHGEGHEVPDIKAGDVILVVKEIPHETFKRKGADLFMEKEIPLLEALTGADFTIEHLDGSKFRVKSNPGEVIQHGMLKTIPEKGLPFHK
jgi:DnaJ homolog subfamily A member 2